MGSYYTIGVDADYRIVSWDEGAEQTFGWKASEVKGLWMPETFVPESEAVFYASVFHQVLTGTTFEGAAKGLTRDGETVPIVGKVIPVLDRSYGVRGMVGQGSLQLPNLRTPQDLGREWNGFLRGERNLSFATARTYEFGVRRLERFAGKTRDQLTDNDLRAYLRQTSDSVATKSSTVQAMHSFHRWGVQEGLWSMNGLMAVQSPMRTREPKACLTPEQAGIALASCERSLRYRLVYLGLYAGVRIGAMAEMEPGHVLADRLRFLDKGRRLREIPLHPELAENLDAVFRRDASKHGLNQACRCLSEDMGIDFTSHALRRTYWQTMVNAGVEIEVADELLGHAPGRTSLQHYGSIPWQRKVEAIATLDYPRVPKAGAQGTLF